ncbi:MAG: NAD(P)-dependent alcohol dehydrogenase [Caulobacterales bacterium]|nr:NAD(P)-dependent alcohol dehydrogenase [Caulobacterales bacterium]
MAVDPGRGRCEVVTAPIPRPGRGQILVRVHVSAVNEMDVQVRAGGWKPQVKAFRRAGPVLTGFEFAGVACGDGVRIRAGQRIIGYTHVLKGPRLHAEYACVDEADLLAIPDNLSDENAAALVAMGLTAIEILEHLRPLSRGRSCLVIGAAGGVGAYAVQLAAGQGAEVTAICSSRNTDWVLGLGARHVRAYETGPRFRPDDRFDLVIDGPARSSFAEAAPHLRRGGTYISTNPLADPWGFVRALASTRRAGWLMMLSTDAARLARLVALHQAGGLFPVIDSVHHLADADTAFDRFAARAKQGRVLLRITPAPT